jgi:flagellar M-ring protein FliF
VLLVLLLAVRPLIAKLKGKGDAAAAPPADDAPLAVIGADDDAADNGIPISAADDGVPLTDLPLQVELARRLAASQPERAVEALQRMLEAPDSRGPEAGAA